MYKISTPDYLTEMPKDPEKELKKLWISVAVIIFFIVLMFIYGKYLHASLIKNGILAQCKTFSITHPAKHGPQLNFTFQFKGKVYEGSGSLPRLKNDEEAFVLLNKSLPLVVDTTDLSNNNILFDSTSIISFGFEYPDTLRWINNFIY